LLYVIAKHVWINIPKLNFDQKKHCLIWTGSYNFIHNSSALGTSAVLYWIQPSLKTAVQI